MVCQAPRGLVLRILGVSVRVDGEPPGVRRVHRIIGGPGPPAEAGPPVVAERLLDPGLVVHDERPVLGDRLTDRPPLEDQDLGARRLRRSPPPARRSGARPRPVPAASWSPMPTDPAKTYMVRTVSAWAVAGRCQLRLRVEPCLPDGDLRLGSGRPRVGGRRQRHHVPEPAGHDGHLDGPPASSFTTSWGRSSRQNIVK